MTAPGSAESMAAYKRPDKKRYHEIETLSKRMVFVLDISASMRDKIVMPVGVSDEEAAQFPSRVKMDIAKNELLERLVHSFPTALFRSHLST